MPTQLTFNPDHGMLTEADVNKLSLMFPVWTIMADIQISERKTRHMLYRPGGIHLATCKRIAECLEICQVSGAHAVRIQTAGDPMQTLAFLYYPGLPVSQEGTPNGQD